MQRQGSKLGEKRKSISEAQIAEITRLYGNFDEGERVKIFPNESFGFLGTQCQQSEPSRCGS